MCEGMAVCYGTIWDSEVRDDGDCHKDVMVMSRGSNTLVCSSPSCDLGGEKNKKTKKQLGEIHKDWSKH